jgi:flagellar hook-basal body complex protein FliE
MSPVGSVNLPPALPGLAGPGRVDAPLPKALTGLTPGGGVQPAPGGFSQMLDGLVSTVDAKEAQATDLTRRVLLGETDQIHQSVIAMQEASVALSLMVEVRNKLVESYQEIMRMQV